MKTSYVVGVIVAMLIIGGIFWFMSQSASPSVTTQTTGGTTVNTQTTTTTPTPAPVTTPASPQAVSIAINNFAFNPNQVSVKAGTKVTWTNSDSAAHTVTSNDSTFDSGTVNPGSSYSFTFTAPGTYSYHCKIHPSMTATVTVTP